MGWQATGFRHQQRKSALDESRQPFLVGQLLVRVVLLGYGVLWADAGSEGEDGVSFGRISTLESIDILSRARLTIILAQAFRRMNAVTVPKFVGVPKDAEEDAKRGN